MTESIIQNKRECYATGKQGALDRHHCFRASRRNKAEKYGLWVWLDHSVHMALHDHRRPYENLENELKKVAQQAFEDNGGTREEFMEHFGANYLD